MILNVLESELYSWAVNQVPIIFCWVVLGHGWVQESVYQEQEGV